MNATGITTGPGGTIATATASRNWRSVSQPNSVTTPPWRKGTIARPLPKTKAPALAKNQPMVQSVCGAAGPPRPVVSQAQGSTAGATAAARDRKPRARHERPPAATKSQTSSDSVQAVTRALAPKSAHSNGSRPTVEADSFQALRATMAITAAPTP